MQNLTNLVWDSLIKISIWNFHIFLDGCRQYKHDYATSYGEAQTPCGFKRMELLCSLETKWRPKVKETIYNYSNVMIMSVSFASVFITLWDLLQVYWVDELLLCWDWKHTKWSRWRTSFPSFSSPSMQGYHVSAPKSQFLWSSCPVAYFHAFRLWVLPIYSSGFLV